MVLQIAYAPKRAKTHRGARMFSRRPMSAHSLPDTCFGDVPSAWTVAGGALLLATLIGHEVAAREPVRVSQPGARGYRTVNSL